MNPKQKPVFKTVNIFNCKTDHSLNIVRFMDGEKVAGLEVKGNLDIPGMVRDVLAEGRIIEPIWVNEVDGIPVIFRGTRRGEAAFALKADPNTPQGVLDALKETPCWYFKGLSREEMTELVNDQTNKKFATSGVIRWIWTLIEQGKSYKELAPVVWSQFETWPSKKMQSAIKKINAMKDGTEKDKAIETALMGTLNQEIVLAYRLGDRVRDAYLIPYLVTDGLVPADTKPEFKASRENLAKLLEAQKADKDSSGGWNEIEGGATFNAVIEEFKKPKESAKGSTRPKSSDVDEFLGSLGSMLGAKIAKYVKEGVKNGTVDEDKIVLGRQVISNFYNENRSRLIAGKLVPIETLMGLLNAVSNGNHAEFKTILVTLTNG